MRYRYYQRNAVGITNDHVETPFAGMISNNCAASIVVIKLCKCSRDTIGNTMVDNRPEMAKDVVFLMHCSYLLANLDSWKSSWELMAWPTSIVSHKHNLWLLLFGELLARPFLLSIQPPLTIGNSIIHQVNLQPVSVLHDSTSYDALAPAEKMNGLCGWKESVAIINHFWCVACPTLNISTPAVSTISIHIVGWLLHRPLERQVLQYPQHSHPTMLWAMFCQHHPLVQPSFYPLAF